MCHVITIICVVCHRLFFMFVLSGRILFAADRLAPDRWFASVEVPWRWRYMYVRNRFGWRQIGQQTLASAYKLLVVLVELFVLKNLGCCSKTAVSHVGNMRN